MNYYDHPALSQSKLKSLLKDRKKFYHKYILKTLKEEETKALKEGKEFDMLLTEPDNFAEQFTILPDLKTTTKENCITQIQYDKYQAMITELKNHEYCDIITLGDLFKTGSFQEELFWKSDNFDIDCKAKLDWISNDKKLIIDIKTTSNMDKVKYDIFSFGYDLQVAMYKLAIKKTYNVDADFLFVFIEKDEPYQVQKVELSDIHITNAFVKLRNAFELYNKYMITNEWAYDNPETLII